MTHTHIIEENARNYKIGTRVRFNYGPMNGEEFGKITGYRVTQFGTVLTAETDDHKERAISGFSTIGIGVYLV